MSRSTVKLHVGDFKDGTKKFEIRHVNDLKFTHPDSLAAPVHRPTRGRPRTSVPADGPVVTDVDDQLKQDGGSKSAPESERKINNQPAKIQTRQTRQLPERSTRNPQPVYVDAISIETGPPRAPPFPKKWWTASATELAELNRKINSKKGAYVS